MTKKQRKALAKKLRAKSKKAQLALEDKEPKASPSKKPSEKNKPSAKAKLKPS